MLISIAASAQDFVMQSNKSNLIEFTHKLTEIPFQNTLINGVDYIDFTKTHKVVTQEKGAPSLPIFHTTIQLPAKGAISYQVIYSEVDTLYNVRVSPSKGNLKRNVVPGQVAYTFGEIYQKNNFYPSSLVAMNNPFVWRTLRAQNVAIHPYRYNAATKQLLVANKITIKIIVDQNQKGVNETKVSNLDPVVGDMQRELLLNDAKEKYISKSESGTMLVIGDSATYYSTLLPLIQWKNQRGLLTHFVSTEKTGVTPESIKLYLTNYYQQHPNLLYVLLVGDHAQIPAYSYGTIGAEELYSDSYYGQLIGGNTDFYPELFIGRFSGKANEVNLMVEKSIEYEKNPITGDWMERAIGLASNEGDGIGNDGEADWLHMRNLRSKLKTFGYSDVYEFYDGTHNGEDASGSPQADKISTAVSTGVGLMNYTGHGSANVCYSGNFQSSDIKSTINYGKYPMVISVACNNGSFMYGDCISEVWLKSEKEGNPTGAIAATGSTILMAWAQPMQTQDELVDLVTKTSNFPTKQTTGGLFYNSQLSMMEEYPNDDGIEVMQTWVFFGDPSVVFRNKITKDIAIAHAQKLSDTMHTFTILGDLEGALVALSQNGVLLGTGLIQGGKTTIHVDKIDAAVNLDVVATKQNYKAFMGKVLSLNAPLVSANVKISPNPANESIKVKSNSAILKTEIVNYMGQLVITESPGLAGEFGIDVSQLEAGIYFVLVSTEEGVVNERVVVIH